jgi:hypothetical protein
MGILRYKTQTYLQHELLFDLCEQLFDLGQKTIRLLNANSNDLSRWSKYKAFLILLLFRNTNAYSGFLILSNEGQKTNAECLLRVILESFIIMKFIQTNKEELAEKFMLSGIMTIKRLHGDNLDEIDKIDPQWKANYEKLKRNYPNERFWSGKDIAKMAEAGGFSDIYKLFYKVLSDRAHPTATSFFNHFSETENGGVFKAQEELSDLENTLSSAFMFYCNILDEVKDEFQTNQEEEFGKIWEKFQMIKNSTKK